MKQFDLIIFDLDGTLVQSAPELADAINDTLRHFAWPTVTEQQVIGWIGHGTYELLVNTLAHVRQTKPDVIRQSDLLKQVVAQFAVLYTRRCATNSPLYPKVRETLQTLHDQGVKLAVVTNKDDCFTQVMLKKHAIAEWFDVVISGDTLPVKKPDPAGVAHCLAKFGIKKDRALFVGDSSVDVATARNAGVAIWALPYGYNEGQPIESSQPDRVIADCSLLLDL
jgi:phosphoglycolate phosphatase